MLDWPNFRGCLQVANVRHEVNAVAHVTPELPIGFCRQPVFSNVLENTVAIDHVTLCTRGRGRRCYLFFGLTLRKNGDFQPEGVGPGDRAAD